MRRNDALALLAALAAGCADTGQDLASVALFVAGTDVSEGVTAKGEVPVMVDRADLAFGPLYLCAGTTAGDLCETARLEWLETVVVDTTRSEPALAGELLGVTGTVRSWMYDLGISSQLTRKEPFILAAARELDGASFVVEGRAVVDGIELPFSASVPIQQTENTELGVPVVRSGESEGFFRDVDVDEAALVVRFEPAAWVQGVDFRRYVAREMCTEGSPEIVCDGLVERSCEGETERSQRDCGELGQVCLPRHGCQKQLTIEDDSEAYRSLRNALLSGGGPAFDWDDVP